MNDLIAIAVRISVMYLYALALIRFSGKRSLGNLSAHDFLVALMLGDLFDDIIWADVPLANGLVAAAVLVAVDVLLGVAELRSPALHKVLSSAPTLVVEEGQWVEKGLRRERESKAEAREHLRLREVRNMGEIERAQYESDGALSVERRTYAQPAQRADLPAVQQRWKQQGDRP